MCQVNRIHTCNHGGEEYPVHSRRPSSPLSLTTVAIKLHIDATAAAVGWAPRMGNHVLVLLGNMEKTASLKGPPSIDKGSVRDVASDIAVERIVRKVDYHIMPLMFACYFLQFLDKVIINYANIMGLSDSLNLGRNDFSWMATAFFIGFAVAEFPQGFLIQRFPVSKVLGINVILWGVTTCCSAAAQNFPGMTAARTILGMFEAVISPSLIMITSQWYNRRQATPRTGLISFAAQAGSRTGDFERWRTLFVAVGAFNLLIGTLVTFWMPSGIDEARFLSQQEKTVLKDSLSAQDGGNNGAKVFRASGIWDALKNLQVWLLLLNTILIVVPSGIITTFSATLIRGFGYDPRQAALLNMPAGVVSVFATLLGTFAILYNFPRWLALCLLMVPTIIGAGLMSFYSSNQAGSLAGIYLINFDVAPLALIYALVGAKVQGYTKKVTTNVIFAIGFSVANIIGPADVSGRRCARLHPGQNHSLLRLWRFCNRQRSYKSSLWLTGPIDIFEDEEYGQPRQSAQQLRSNTGMAPRQVESPERRYDTLLLSETSSPAGRPQTGHSPWSSSTIEACRDFQKANYKLPHGPQTNRMPKVCCHQGQVYGENALLQVPEAPSAVHRREDVNSAQRLALNENSSGKQRVRHTKSSTGCVNCRRRRKKCDEMQPACGGCERLNLQCLPRSETSEFRGTCSAVGALGNRDEAAEYHYSGGDDSSDEDDNQAPPALGWLNIINRENIADSSSSSSLAHSSALKVLPDRRASDTAPSEDGITLPPIALSNYAGINPVAQDDWTTGERHLLNHFLQSVARSMSMTEDKYNPFIRLVVPMVFESKEVRNALVALSATHLSKVYPDFQINHLIHRNMTLEDLKWRLGSPETVVSALTATLLLCLSEICERHSRWLLYLHSARALLEQLTQGVSELLTDFLIDLYNYICCVGFTTSSDVPRPWGKRFGLHSTGPDGIHALFGSDPGLYKCLARINQLSRQQSLATDPGSHEKLRRKALTLEKDLQDCGGLRDIESEDEAAACAVRWALILRLREIARPGLETASPQVQVLVNNINSAISSIRPGSRAESHLLFPMFMAGVGSITKASRLEIEYRVNIAEKTMGFG
ncbi:hypothetical protein S40288_06830 [Stachybotrys chartarum IBT 40288]|nr:hypothetical protein S40288_06830 [Stachybotrys chartarum IBT 40288]